MSPGRVATAVRAVEGAIVFTDLAGFTEFTAVRGDDAALALLSLQERLVRHEMGDSGRIVKNLGDGLMLWFDDACDAVRTALGLQESFEESASDDEFPLWVRIGVHYGRCARRGRDLIGHDVNVAARIVELAAPGEVLVSESATERAREALPEVVFEEVGPTLMRGIPNPVGLFRAVKS